MHHTPSRIERHPNLPLQSLFTRWAACFFVAVLAAGFGCTSSALAEGVPDTQTIVTVDWTNPTGKINRALFSLEGLPKVYQIAKDSPTLMPSFLLLNPQETMTRMETWIHLMEPENDNDDPDVYDWDRLHPEDMVRFIEDREDYEATLDRLGTERLSLLCYNVDWNRSGVEEDPVADKVEWAEFAAAVVTDYNGSDPSVTPRLRYVEIWNEPNMPMFYGGTRETYFELFNITAERLHREHPEVMVGGPALTPAHWAEPEEWYSDFIEACGQNADFVIHHIYHGHGDRSPKDLANELIDKTDQFRALPGKADGKISITELDAWFSGWPKLQYMLGRHFRFLEIQDRILSIHHFTTLAYNEQGNYAFGVMDNQGAPLLGTYWPYWLFRNVIGEHTFHTIRGDGEHELDAIATRHVNPDGATLQSFVLHNPTDRTIRADVRLHFHAADDDRVLSVDRVTESFQGTADALHVPAGEAYRNLTLKLSSGEAVALNLRKPGKRHFTFSDLNNQVYPFMMIQSDREEAALGDTITLTARILNTTPEPISGTIEFKGLSDDWPIEIIEGDATVNNLAFGESQQVVVKIKLTTRPDHQPRMTYTERSEMQDLDVGVTPYVVLDTDQSPDAADLDGTAHSIPTAIILKIKAE